MNIAKKVTILILFIAGCIGSFIFGGSITKETFSNQLSVTQAMLAFNNINRFEHMHTCVEQEQYAKLKLRLENSLISERLLLAEFLNSLDDEWLNAYITTRSEAELCSSCTKPID